MFVNELKEIAETLNCNPQSFPKDTDEPSKWIVGTFSFFAFSSIFSALFVGTDSEITINLQFLIEAIICFTPIMRYFSLIASISAFSKSFVIMPCIAKLFWCPL